MISPSLALPFPPWVSTSSNPGSQDHAINGTLFSYTECLPFSFQRECLTIVLQVWQPVIHACRLEGTGRCSWYQKKYRDTTLGQKNPSLQRWRKEDFPKISQMVWKISNTGEANWKLKLIQFEFSQGRRVQTVGRLTSIRWGDGPGCLPLRTGGREWTSSFAHHVRWKIIDRQLRKMRSWQGSMQVLQVLRRETFQASLKVPATGVLFLWVNKLEDKMDETSQLTR